MAYDIAIIGGGASGMVAALRAKALLQGGNICILERQPRLGKKLLATGNGRCNITNMLSDRTYYHGDPDFVVPALEKYPPSAVRDFFSSIGVETFEEDGGRVYPMGEQASSVLDALRLSLAEQDIEVQTECEVSRIAAQKGGFSLRCEKGDAVFARRVIVSAGGPASQNLGGTNLGTKLLAPLGHASLPCLPALVQLKTETEPIRALKGIKYTGEISILVDGQVRRTETGEVLFTEYGVSGPPVLQLSRTASVAIAEGRRVFVRMKVLAMTEDATYALLASRREAIPARSLEHFFAGLTNKRIGQTILKLAGAVPFSRPAQSLSEEELRRISRLLTGWELEVLGTQPLSQAQVTVGGLDTHLFSAHTMESKIVKGLYATGELLNIDGDCGGFNLQWAWASGLCAGENAARSLHEGKEPL
ncbi:MAG: NAD(P)/FAD-dependent oxidoreductase [Christensenellales bacterium]|jgi:predicted Rossmann fold flavoprotein